MLRSMQSRVITLFQKWSSSKIPHILNIPLAVFRFLLMLSFPSYHWECLYIQKKKLFLISNVSLIKTEQSGCQVLLEHVSTKLKIDDIYKTSVLSLRKTVLEKLAHHKIQKGEKIYAKRVSSFWSSSLKLMKNMSLIASQNYFGKTHAT